MNLERNSGKIIGLTQGLECRPFFRMIHLHSNTDCGTFPPGWFLHTTRSADGGSQSKTEARAHNPRSRPTRIMSSVLGVDAISTGQRVDEKVGARGLRLVLSGMPIHHARWIDQAQRRNMGCENEKRREAPTRCLSRRCTSKGKKEVSPGISPQAHLKCVLSNRPLGPTTVLRTSLSLV